MSLIVIYRSFCIHVFYTWGGGGECVNYTWHEHSRKKKLFFKIEEEKKFNVLLYFIRVKFLKS